MRKWVWGLLAVLWAVPMRAGSVDRLESLSGLSVLVEVYTYDPGTFKVKQVAKTSILESVDAYRPESENWFIRPYKNPATAFTQPEFRAIVDWAKREAAPGLVLDGHPEIGDEDVVRLPGLQKLTLLSLRKASMTDRGLNNLNSIKSLRYLDVSETQVTAAGLMKLKLPKLEKFVSEGTKITSDDFGQFQARMKGKVALLPAEWSLLWDPVRNPAPADKPTSYFVGKSPESEKKKDEKQGD